MRKRFKSAAVILVITLIMSFFFPNHTIALSIASDEKEAFETAENLRVKIQENVPQCIWTEDTQCSRVTYLYDLDNRINGYIFEYSTLEKKTGYIQISTALGYPILDSYALEGVHWAAEKVYNTQDKLIYIGGISYYTKKEQLFSISDSIVSLSENDVMSSSKSELKQYYGMYLDNIGNSSKRQSAARGFNTITKFVQGYTGNITFATYANTPYSQNIDCARISALNVSIYWAKCRGKTGLYAGNVTTGYDQMANYIPIPDGRAMDQALYDGLYNYMKSKGYTPNYRGKITFSSNNNTSTIGDGIWKWDEIKTLIDNGVPPNIAVCVPGGGYHAVVIMGYQYIEVENTFMILDATSTTTVYKTLSSFSPGCNIFSSYTGWR